MHAKFLNTKIIHTVLLEKSVGRDRMSVRDFSVKKTGILFLFSLLWLFLGYWIITQLFEFGDSWTPILFLLIPYLVIVSQVFGIGIKVGPTGVEVTPPPIAEKVTEVETAGSLANKLSVQISSERNELINLMTKGQFENLSQSDLNRINVSEISKYVAVYEISPLSRVLNISRITRSKYFPVIDNDETRELKGVITLSEILDYMKRGEAWVDATVDRVLSSKKPAERAFINETSKEVLLRMLKNDLTRLPVVDARNRLKGVITLKDLSDVVTKEPKTM